MNVIIISEVFKSKHKKGFSDMNGIKHFRERANITQRQLADLMNVSLSTVRRWDKNFDNMPLRKAQELAFILDISLDELLGNK